VKLSLHRGKERQTFDLHRLVVQAFLPARQEGQETNHKDGNKNNNRADNLEWVTPSENLKHSYRLGLHQPTVLRGEDSGSAKLTGQQVREIRASEGTVSRHRLAAMYGVSRIHITRIQRGTVWRDI
jgi:hypothetical protein